jgi:hypothetical protein
MKFGETWFCVVSATAFVVLVTLWLLCRLAAQATKPTRVQRHDCTDNLVFDWLKQRPTQGATVEYVAGEVGRTLTEVSGAIERLSAANEIQNSGPNWFLARKPHLRCFIPSPDRSLR